MVNPSFLMMIPVNKTIFIAFMTLGIYIYLTYFNIYYCVRLKLYATMFALKSVPDPPDQILCCNVVAL